MREQVKRVKKLRHTLLYGDFHRLLSPYQGNETAWITVSKDKAEAVVMLVRAQAMSNELPPMLRLCGLDAAACYLVEETGETYTGAELMNCGLVFPIGWGDAASISYTLRKED